MIRIKRKGGVVFEARVWSPTGGWRAGAHLRLGVGPQPGELPRAPQFRHAGVESVRQDDGEGHALLRLVCGVAEHQALQRTPASDHRLQRSSNLKPHWPSILAGMQLLHWALVEGKTWSPNSTL